MKTFRVVIKSIIGFIGLLLISVFSATASAHLAGITDTSIQIGHSQVKVVYTLPTDSIAELFVDQSAKFLPKDKITQGVADGFRVVNSGEQCRIKSSEQRAIDKVESTQFILFYLCQNTLGVVDIHYDLFVDRFKDHENFTRIAMGDKYVSLVLSMDQTFTQIPVQKTLKQWGITLSDDFADDPNASLKLNAQPSYFPLGIEHILVGYDHLLFLFALLLLPLGFKQLIAMVTSFTIAHSITLAMAVFDLVSLPALWVEAVIALSIVYVGVENLLELRGHTGTNALNTPWKRRVLVTFCFGLIHGFGFSYVLREIGLGDQVASALLFFNLGVEAGQLVAVSITFPLLLWIYKRWPALGFSRACSILVILLGGMWFVERVIAVAS